MAGPGAGHVAGSARALPAEQPEGSYAAAVHFYIRLDGQEAIHRQDLGVSDVKVA